tara:strand:+ start:44 stop:787 length:744 start_codon:yes stop_codon:yes gene_type:complete
MREEGKQLELFGNGFLSVDQQKQVDEFLDINKSHNALNIENAKSTALLLDEAGFDRDFDYKFTLQSKEITREKSFGYTHNNTQFNAEVTFTSVVVGVYIQANVIKDGEIIKRNFQVTSEDGKIMCNGITDQYRYYKPSTLLNKLVDFNKNVVNQLELENKQIIALNTISNKYRELCPEAKVTIGNDYYRGTRNYDSFPTIKVEFKSGSSITLRLGYGDTMDQEILWKKHDAQKEELGDLITRFNNQK